MHVARLWSANPCSLSSPKLKLMKGGGNSLALSLLEKVPRSRGFHRTLPPLLVVQRKWGESQKARAKYVDLFKDKRPSGV